MLAHRPHPLPATGRVALDQGHDPRALGWQHLHPQPVTPRGDFDPRPGHTRDRLHHRSTGRRPGHRQEFIRAVREFFYSEDLEAPGSLLFGHLSR
ncbi:hypothetical protein OHA16_10815 [Kitasatospora purpeofusca]|uniref:Uncharacterized protein n=1 Tax=Kitasatospora purpeofusca TaxID=67352 RepID=A0ABZ1TXS1_9ACTN